jgi:hypothetical protein
MTGNSAVPENSLCEKPNTARVFPGFIHGSESSRQYQGTQRACENRVLVAEGTESIISVSFLRLSGTAHILTPASWVFAVLEKMQPTPQAVGVLQKIGVSVRRKNHMPSALNDSVPARDERSTQLQNLRQFVNLSLCSNSPLRFFGSLDINNSPRADVWQPVVLLNLSWHPGI